MEYQNILFLFISGSNFRGVARRPGAWQAGLCRAALSLRTQKRRKYCRFCVAYAFFEKRLGPFQSLTH
ncbi:MAG: hypothetical protein JXR70_18325 [Spirochaetales bacterium]|nr:hypothetical protein [Spirochaetales bacterium]